MPQHSSVPLIGTDLASLLSDLQAVIGSVVLLLGRSPVLFARRLLSVGPHLPAGAFSLAGGNVVTVAGVVTVGQKEIFPAVVAAPWCVA